MPRAPSEVVVIGLLGAIGITAVKLWGGLGIPIFFAILGTLAAGMWGHILYCRWKIAEILSHLSAEAREAYLENLDPDSRCETERDLLRFFHI
jgi:hypothetical protein